MKLTTLSAMLEFHSEELEAKANTARYKAGQYLKKGAREQARSQITYNLQYIAWAGALQDYKGSIDGLNVRLQQGDYLKQAVKVLHSVKDNLQDLKRAIPSINNLARQADEITTSVNHLQLAGKVTGHAIQPAITPSMVNPASVDEELVKLEEQLGYSKFPKIDERISKAKQNLQRLGNAKKKEGSTTG